MTAAKDRYLVTGGAGFCGFEITQHLLEKGLSVRVLDLEPLPAPMPGVEFIQGDIRDERVVAAACQGVQRVIHTVAKVPVSKAGRGFWDINVGGTEVLLRAAVSAGVRKVVHLSSSSVQSAERMPVEESDPCHAVEAYSASKLDAEGACLRMIRPGFDVDIVRPRTVVGPGRLGIFSMLFEWIADDLNVYMMGPGTNIIQFLHSRDLAECCYLASRQDSSGVYNVGGKSYGPLREDLSFLLEHAKSSSKLVSLPIGLTRVALRLLDWLGLSPLGPFHYLTYAHSFYVTNAKAKHGLGWEPVYGNHEILSAAYDSFLAARHQRSTAYGSTHRKTLRQGVLRMINRLLSF